LVKSFLASVNSFFSKNIKKLLLFKKIEYKIQHFKVDKAFALYYLCSIYVILEGGEKLMKKVIALVLSLMLLVAFTLGCKPAETPKPEAPKPAEAPAPATAPAPAPEKPAEAPAPAPAPEKPAHK
jgi:hypothetical protein